VAKDERQGDGQRKEEIAMGLWDKIKGELIDIVEWLDPTSDTLVYRFERYNNEIKYGAKLVVRQAQAAVFVNMGQIADVFQSGMYTLDTRNLPILSTLMGWKYGFNSPFKCEVYFVNTRKFTDRKWGTKNPVMMRDAEFGPVRLRAFGTYALRVKDPARFITQIAGTDARFTTDEITEQLRNIIVTRFADHVGESRIPVLELAASYDELGHALLKKIQPEFDDYGIEVSTLLVENVSLPAEVEAALDKRTSMGVIGDMTRFTQFQAASALTDAARNPGGGAGGMMGMGVGVMMAGQVGQAMGGAAAAPAATAPPPMPQAPSFFVGLGGRQAGPYDASALQQQVLGGKLTRETLVWRPGFPNWTPAGQVPELASLFGQVPPPLPA
jgi:membrane protease subunit (stomatin/prohibitin family)